MKVFMSWSGDRSRAAAELLKWWTRSVIQASRPWISTEDIDRGALWFSEINSGLNETAVGIVCLTHENKDRPWILFEAGALAKGLSNSRVCTFLVDLEPQDIQDPLAQFNHTQPTETDMRKLARTLNRGLASNALEEDVLMNAFDAYWPQFMAKWKALIDSIPQVTKVVKRPADDIMSEILENVRGMNQRIRKLEMSTEQLPDWAVAPVSELNSQQRSVRMMLMARMKESYSRGNPLDNFIQEGDSMGFNAITMHAMIRQVVEELKQQPRSQGKGVKIPRGPVAGGGGLLDIP